MFKYIQITTVTFGLVFFFQCSIALANIYDLSYSGKLVKENGDPMKGEVSMKLSFYDSFEADTPILSTSYSNVKLGNNGDFSLTIGLTNALQEKLKTETWVELKVEGMTYARSLYTAVPYATRAPLTGITIPTTCVDGDQIVVAGGKVVCTAPVDLSAHDFNSSANISANTISASALVATSSSSPGLTVDGKNLANNNDMSTVWKNDTTNVAWVTKEGKIRASLFEGDVAGNATTATAADVAAVADALNEDNTYTFKSFVHGTSTDQEPAISGPANELVYAWTTSTGLVLGPDGSNGFDLDVNGDIQANKVTLQDSIVISKTEIAGPVTTTTNVTLSADNEQALAIEKTVDNGGSVTVRKTIIGAGIIKTVDGNGDSVTTEIDGVQLGSLATKNTVSSSDLDAASIGDAAIDSISSAKISGLGSLATKNSVSGSDLASNISISTTGNITTTGSGVFTGNGSGLTALDASKVSGALSNATIAGSSVTGTIANSQLASGIDASKITTGTIPDAQLPSSITASKVNGALSNATIAGSAVTGTIANSQLASGIDASKITTGSLDGSLVGDGIDASNITTGTLNGNLISTNILTSGSSNIRIGGSGKVGIGKAPGSYKLDVSGTIYAGPTIRIAGTHPDTTATLELYQGYDGSRGYIQKTLYDFIFVNKTGGVYLSGGATGWSSMSDQRLKKDITSIPDALDKINQIQGYTYHYKTDSDDSPLRAGVIAQEVQKVLPEAISKNEEGYLTVRYTEIVPLVINAVKELYAKWLDDHERIDALEKENQDLKSYLCAKDQHAPFCGN